MQKSKKRIFLINRDFQLRYSWLAAFVGIISTLLTGIVLLYPLYQFEILRIPKFLPVPILMGMVAATLINILLIAGLGIFVTHRIAGPMYSLVRAFRRLELGRWHGELKIRDNDDMHYVVRNFNELVASLVVAAKHDKQLVLNIQANIEKNPDAAKSDLSKLAKIIQHRLGE